MEILTQKENLGLSAVLFDKVIEQGVTVELNLPDYMPDIVRVIRASVTPRVSAVSVIGDRITVDGSLEAQLLYSCEAGELYTYSQSQDFSRYAECRSVNATDIVSAKTICDYANCRALSPKRAEIKGNISIPIKVVRKENRELLSGATGGGIQLKVEPISAVSVTAIGEKTFSMSDVFELPDSKEDIRNILYASAFAVPGEIKQINNKLMVRGELSVDVAYIPESRSASVEHITHSLPLSQIIELEGVRDGCVCDVALSVPSVEVIVKPKADNTLRILDVSAVVAASLTAAEQVETSVVLDAYSISQNLDIKTETRPVTVTVEKVNEPFVIKQSVDISQNDVGSILDVRIEPQGLTASANESELNAAGTIKVSMLYTDAAMQIGYMEKLLDYSCSAVNKTGKPARFDPKVVLTGSGFMMSSPDRVDIKAEAVLGGSVWAENPMTSISEITSLGEREKANTGRAVTIYFAQENENLWGIARRYNTTVEAIAGENGIPDEPIAEKTMLIIPSI